MVRARLQPLVLKPGGQSRCAKFGGVTTAQDPQLPRDEGGGGGGRVTPRRRRPECLWLTPGLRRRNQGRQLFGAHLGAPLGSARGGPCLCLTLVALGPTSLQATGWTPTCRPVGALAQALGTGAAEARTAAAAGEGGLTIRTGTRRPWGGRGAHAGGGCGSERPGLTACLARPVRVVTPAPKALLSPLPSQAGLLLSCWCIKV